MEEKVIKTNDTPPAKMIVENRINRFGKIFFNFAITVAFLTLFAFLSTLLTPILYIFVLAVLFCVICGIFIFSLGFVLTIPDNILGKLWALLGNLLNSGDSMGVFIAYCFDISKWLSLVGAIVSAISIVFIALTKRRNKTTKIVILSILMALFLVYFILQIITGGVQW